MAPGTIDRQFGLLVIARVVGKLGLPCECRRRRDRTALDASQCAQLFLDHGRTLPRWRRRGKTPFQTCPFEYIDDGGKAA
jgi:hypothetical protein